MSKVVKAAFTDELGDIEDMLPSLPPKKTRTAQPTPAPEPTRPAITEASHDVIEATSEQEQTPADNRTSRAEKTQTQVTAPAGDETTRQRETGNNRSETTSAPTADISSTNLKNLRALTNAEKARNPITARTYGDVVLDAIEAHAEELRTYWKQPDAQAKPSTGLFKRQPVINKRRRHAEPPAQITLLGLGEENAKALEKYWGDWGAPSRSAFVDQALTLYLKPKSRRKAAGE